MPNGDPEFGALGVGGGRRWNTPPVQGHPENSTPVERRRRSSGKKGHPEPGTPVFGWRGKQFPVQQRSLENFVNFPYFFVTFKQGSSRGAASGGSDF